MGRVAAAAVEDHGVMKIMTLFTLFARGSPRTVAAMQSTVVRNHAF
jgi:hypothetical protein